MSQEPQQSRPYGDSEAEPLGVAPHLADYWQVVSRRLWLVLLIFAVTTASSIWAVSLRRTFYQAHVALRVNDPLQPARGLVTGARVSGMDIYVDPIESEIQVLRSGQVARGVVDSLGLRFRPADRDIVRSSLAREITVDPTTPSGSYEVVYDASGRTASLRTAQGEVLGTADVGQVLDAGTVRFVPNPPPGEARVYDVRIDPVSQVAQEVSANITAQRRENTNIIDANYLSPDPVLAPQILNAAVVQLRKLGAERVVQQAEKDVQFVEQQLDSVRQERKEIGRRIQQFKESRDFTTLSDREQQLVNEIQRVNRQFETLDEQRAALADLERRLESGAAAETDFAPILAVLPEGTSPQIRSLIDQVREKQRNLRALRTEEQLAEAHPQVRAVRSEIVELGDDLLEAVRARLGVLSTRLTQLGTEQDQLRNEQARFPDLQSQLTQLEERRSLFDETHQFLLSQRLQADIVRGGVTPYVDVIDPADGAMPIQPRGRVNVFLGALLGLILGVGAAFFLEYLDRTVRTSSDVESLLGIPVLGVIPRLRRLGEEEGGEAAPHGKGLPLVVALDPLDPAAEAYRNLRMNLTFMGSEDEPVRSILFSSPGPDEGKSTTAVNFAVMLAQQGERVLLLDADLRRPALHRALDLLREPGLTNLLIGDAEPREAVRPNVLPNLDVLPSGPFPPNPSELLNSKAMERLLEHFGERYGQIVIDSPPILAVTDSAVLAAHTDGVVLVLRSGETEQRAAERSVDQLRRLGVRMFGAVLNEVSSGSTDDSYYLQYYYSYHPTQSGWDRLRQGLSRTRFW